MRSPLAPLALAVASFAAGCPDSPGDDGGDPPVEVSLGSIVLLQDRAPFWQASASFTADADAAPSGCEVEDVAGCTFITCAAGAAPIAPDAHLDAGAITIATEAKEVTLTRDADGLYAPVVEQGEEFFANGEELTAAAAGGADIEAFSLTLRAPTPLQMTSPPLASVTVKVTEALPTEWTGTSQGELSFTLSDPTGTRSATCSAASTAGAFAIPAEVVGRFPVGSGNLNITGRVAVDAALANARHTTFSVLTAATSAVGVNASYFVTFAAP